VLRKLLAGLLLTTFLVATTGFVLTQCCCDKSPAKDCCRKDNRGCKSEVTFFKLKADYQAGAAQQLSAASFFVVLAFMPFDVLRSDAAATRPFNDTGPPALLSLSTLSRLQVFRI